jgi:membrane fusion protein, heavy metal efflux system
MTQFLMTHFFMTHSASKGAGSNWPLNKTFFTLKAGLLLLLALIGLLGSLNALASAADGDSRATGHGEEHGTDEEHARPLRLSQAQRQLAGIELRSLTSSGHVDTGWDLDRVASATLQVDRDKTVTLSSQLEVRVMARHVVPGQDVGAGEPLLTLGGAAVAQAQANYINAAADWSRIRRMGEGAVSASARLQSRVDASLKRAILESLGMTKAQIQVLESNPDAIGSFALLAPISGRVQQDLARLGQVVAAGTALLQLTDESRLWVEARLTAAQAEKILVGSTALVRVDDKTYEARIIGRSHELDALTRTEQVLLSMDNPGQLLHAGQFAELYFSSRQTGDTAKANDAAGEGRDPGLTLVLPDAALSRSSDGDWQVFIEDEDGFEAREVRVLQRRRGLNLVTGESLTKARAANAKVVTAGAFFLASELAKAGFDIHGH